MPVGEYPLIGSSRGSTASRSARRVPRVAGHLGSTCVAAPSVATGPAAVYMAAARAHSRTCTARALRARRRVVAAARGPLYAARGLGPTSPPPQ